MATIGLALLAVTMLFLFAEEEGPVPKALARIGFYVSAVACLASAFI